MRIPGQRDVAVLHALRRGDQFYRWRRGGQRGRGRHGPVQAKRPGRGRPVGTARPRRPGSRGPRRYHDAHRNPGAGNPVRRGSGRPGHPGASGLSSRHPRPGRRGRCRVRRRPPPDHAVPAEAAAPEPDQPATDQPAADQPGPPSQDSPAPPARALPTGMPEDAEPPRLVQIDAEPDHEAWPEDPWLPGSRRPDRRALIIGVVLIAGLLSVASTAWLIRVNPPEASRPHGAHLSRPSQLGSGHTQSTQALSGQPTPILIQPSPPAPSQPRPGQLQPSQPAPTQSGTGPARPGHTGPSQSGHNQPGHNQSSSGHPGTSRSGTGHSRPGQLGTGQTGTHRAGSGQTGPGQAGPGPGSGPSGSGPSGSGPSGPGPSGSGQTGPGQTGLRPVRLRPIRLRPIRDRPRHHPDGPASAPAGSWVPWWWGATAPTPGHRVDHARPGRPG